ncbi:fatty acid desaturase [Oceaniserpentilla sp. 4NH20-0058]|uniref:fatty acid desaturase n=1 Tax=Oceaniserpentilla sp. 4NH20-0058 TaxID=3127660 RepID=UPI00310A249E
MQLTDKQKIQYIRKAVRAEGDAIRERHPILAHKNLMAMIIFIFSVLAVVLTGYAYLQQWIPAYVCIVVVAICTSFLHELEHDLIHWMYFKKSPLIHHFMLLVGWILRPGTINPWVRRNLHFEHHKLSGTPEDIEERGIGNGLKIGPLRLIVMLDTLTGGVIRALVQKVGFEKIESAVLTILAHAPFAVITVVLWYGFLGFHLANIFELGIHWQGSTIEFMHTIEPLIVILIAPFYVRSFCLNLISSNMHYYGNVTSVMRQTQVLNHPILWPLQLFCFNFGATHAIHHFVVAEPFYIRQLTAKKAHKVMKLYGVRFNDFSSMMHGNVYSLSKSEV